MERKIIIKGARQHNLKNIDLEIPKEKFVVITGVSGSGKSTLAFDTIYAEGQRRYVESLSAYARQFLEQMEKPDVDSIEGLSPAIAIEQKSISKNPRSTVATVTEIYDYLRVLFATVGIPYCYKCGKLITSQSTEEIVDAICSLKEGARIYILAPIVRGRKGEYKKGLSKLRRDGFVRVKIDGEIFDLSQDIELDRNKVHHIDVVVDRLVIKEGIKKRLTDSVEMALSLGEGLIKVEILGDKEILFSQNLSCPDCGISYPEITPRFFSFNSPYGACPRCQGIGTIVYFDPELVIPNPELSIRDGAIFPWAQREDPYFRKFIVALAKHLNFSLDTPFSKLDDKIKKAILYGLDGEKVEVEYGGRLIKKEFRGVLAELEDEYYNTDSFIIKRELERYMSKRPCPSCGGARLRKESLCIKVGSKSIYEITKMTIEEALNFFLNLKLKDKERKISERVLKEIIDRLKFLIDVGLPYLTLDRPSQTLSGGEAQRIKLATQIGSKLSGVLYVLDEPTIGLHQRDTEMLIKTLKELRDQGNTVIVVEHDERTIRAADYLVDLGPGSGRDGGYLVFCGSPKDIENVKDSITGAYLSKRAKIPTHNRKRPSQRWITIKGACGNNLKGIDVSIPVGLMTCVTGVSGSGKSSLIMDTLYNYLSRKFHNSYRKPLPFSSISGLEYINNVIHIDQSPIGRTPRSNPATYTGAFTPIRELFASLPESRARGYKPGRFSFNVWGGRCDVCQGEGMIKVEMHFLPDVYVKCEACKGKRFNRQTLEIRYKGKNIADVLDMTVDEAREFFEKIPKIMSKLNLLSEVGLGYIKLGQPATTLSGGEAQRIKLARELSKKSTGKTLYILDEPTIGLHFDDIKKLLSVLLKLRDLGNTIVIIEHNLDVMKVCDWIIDLGPEGGEKGGYVVAYGTPYEVSLAEGSYTGQFLRKVFEQEGVEIRRDGKIYV